MQWYRNQRTAAKIISLVLLMAVFLGLVGFIGYYYNHKAGQALTNLYSDNLISVESIIEARTYNRTSQALTLELILAPVDQAKAKDLQNEISARTTEYDGVLKTFGSTNLDTSERNKLQQIQADTQIYRQERDKAIQMALAGDRLGAYQSFAKNAMPHLDNMNNTLLELADYSIKESEQINKQNKADESFATKILLFTPMVICILAIVLGLLVARMISVPLTAMVGIAQEVAGGNLAVKRVAVKSQDETGKLSQAFDTMNANLANLIKQVSASTELVAASAEELTASAEQHALATNQVARAITGVAASTEKQSDAVNETSAAIEQISASIQQVAANSTTVASLMEETAAASREGQKSVDKAVSQMNQVGKGSSEVEAAIRGLEASSNKIGEIINVISGIASQTNLLALNAAIEAARAGDQGRGFAVVAEEVRKLAEQSQVATKEIAALINENKANIDNAVRSMESGSKDVQTGIEVVYAAGDSFAAIANAINKVSSQIQEISSTIQQMAGGSQQIVASIQEIDTISKENSGQAQTVSAATEEQAASVEQIANASQELARMAQDLQMAISKFRV